MRILSYILMLFVISTITGCSWCTRTEYVNVPYEVKVPVKCVVPDANCTFDRNTSNGVITSLLECIVDMKRNAEVCGE